MYQVLDKDIIEFEIVKYIPENKRGFKPWLSIVAIVDAILYKLKTGLQWVYASGKKPFYWIGLQLEQCVLAFQKWSKIDVWDKIWISLLKSRRIRLDWSHVNFCGIHMPCTKGWEKVSYQGRKKREITNSL